MEERILLTRSRRPIPPIGATDLKRLCIDDRSGKENLSTLSALRDVAVSGWKGEDLGFVASIGRLRRLKIEAAGQLGEILDARVTSLAPLRELSRLRVLKLVGSPRIDQAALPDLSDLAKLKLLETITITYAGTLKSLAPLLQLPRLCEVRLRQTLALDGGPVTPRSFGGGCHSRRAPRLTARLALGTETQRHGAAADRPSRTVTIAQGRRPDVPRGVHPIFFGPRIVDLRMRVRSVSWRSWL